MLKIMEDSLRAFVSMSIHTMLQTKIVKSSKISNLMQFKRASVLT